MDITTVNGQLAEYMKGMENVPKLGYALWYTISQASMPHTRFSDLLMVRDLAPLPPRPLPGRAFERVVGKIDLKSRNDASIGRRYMIRKVNAGGRNVRKIVAEDVGVENHEITMGYTPSVELWFDKSTDRIESSTDVVEDPTILAIAREIRDEFDLKRDHVTSYTIREWLRHYLLGLGAVPIRESGGVYFLHETKAPELEKLIDLVATVNSGSSIHVMPLPDNANQRELVRASFVRSADSEASSLLNEIGSITGQISEKRHMKIMEEWMAINDKYRAYAGLMGEGLEEARGTVDLTKHLIDGLEVNYK